jgi:O-methyltransferase involved in polyketide biosynthesis
MTCWNASHAVPADGLLWTGKGDTLCWPGRTTELPRDVHVDTSVPRTARIWNYLLGGTDNFASDRAVGDEILANLPHLAENARLSRSYLARVTRWLTTEAGVRQFLDIGTGLPTAENTHTVAQSVAPDARIVYVDHDPMVLEQARALLTSTPEGATAYVHADLRDPDAILAEAAKTLDLTKPVALFLMGVLGHVESDDEAKRLIDAYLGALAPGSYFAMYDGSDTSPENTEVVRIWNLSANPKYHLRTPERFAALFDGLELIEPGVTSAPLWRPATADPKPLDVVCGVARKN